MMILACILSLPLQFEFPMQQLATGKGPVDVAVADIDLDGRPDLLTCNNSGHDLTLRRGDGWGGFGEIESFPLPNSAGRMVVDDFDGDGWLDVVVSLPLADRVAVMRGDAAGGLLPPVNPGAGDHPVGLASGDIDGDGVQDLVIANDNEDKLSVLLGTGAAQFKPGVVVPTGNGPGVALADLDVDGHLDLVVPGFDDLSVHAGVGHGQFGPPVSNTLLTPVVDLALGDLDENGYPDAVTCSSYGPKISILLDDAAGGFEPYKTVYVDSFHDPTGALIVDFDEDGHVDVVISSGPSFPNDDEWGSTIRFFQGDGSGTLGTSVATQVAGHSPRFVAADIVVDGHLDLLLIPSPADGVLLLPGDGHGGVPEQKDSIAGSSVLQFGLGDADGDGLVDGAFPWSGGPYALVRVMLGTGEGDLDYVWQDYLQESWATVARLADLDEDGDAELVVAQGDGPVEIRSGDGTGDFGDDPDLTTPAGVGSIGLELLDVQGDGHLDVVTADAGPGVLTITPGDGTLGFGPSSPVQVGADPADLAAADLDGDGVTELVTANKGSHTLSVVPFGSSASTVPVPDGARALALGDIDDDGARDAVVCGDGDALSLLLGDGAAGLLPFAVVHPDIVSGDPLLADLDDDGHADLVLPDKERRAVALLRGAGDGSFGTPQFLGAGDAPSFVQVADFDLDGLLDVATLWGGSTLAVHVQQAPGPFSLVPGGAAGLHGAPLLKLAGSLEPGSDIFLLLQGAAPGALVVMLAGSRAALVPFKGGVLVPAPELILPLAATDAAGTLTLRSKWPAGIASGLSWFAQAWLADHAAAQGWAGSTGVKLVTP